VVRHRQLLSAVGESEWCVPSSAFRIVCFNYWLTWEKRRSWSLSSFSFFFSTTLSSSGSQEVEQALVLGEYEGCCCSVETTDPSRCFPANENLSTHLSLSGQRLAFGQCVLLSGSLPPKSIALPLRSGYLLAPYFPITVCMLVDALKEGKNDIMDEKHTFQDTTHGSLTLIAPVWSWTSGRGRILSLLMWCRWSAYFL